MLAWLCGLAVFAIVVALFLRFYPPLGSSQSKERRQAFSRLSHYSGKSFKNAVPTATMTISSSSNSGSLLAEYLKGNPEARPNKPIAVLQMADNDFISEAGQSRLTWFGHSAAMLQLDGKVLLLDPMFGKAPSPFPFIGKGRYSGKLPFELEQLKQIDAVILSHDHYDHLDYGSIMKLKHKVRQFIVPLGVASHLIKWGVRPETIKELNWWEEYQYEGFRLVCTPARHFSGRSLADRNATLWCSWVIQGKEEKVFFSGDSGYGPHFKEIGEKYGPFDLTLMECGQYNERWASIHMMPEQTVQAHLDVKGDVLIPIHWGAFTLSLHSWTDPVERAVKAAEDQSVKICTPRIGESVTVKGNAYPASAWWR